MKIRASSVKIELPLDPCNSFDFNNLHSIFACICTLSKVASTFKTNRLFASNSHNSSFIEFHLFD